MFLRFCAAVACFCLLKPGIAASSDFYPEDRLVMSAFAVCGEEMIEASLLQDQITDGFFVRVHDGRMLRFREAESFNAQTSPSPLTTPKIQEIYFKQPRCLHGVMKLSTFDAEYLNFIEEFTAYITKIFADTDPDLRSANLRALQPLEAQQVVFAD